jgi:hypothetical protein
MGILRRIVGFVDLDGSGFEKNAIKVENQAAQMSKKVNDHLLHMGAGIVAGFGFDALLRGSIESIKHFHDLAEEFRVTTDTAQRWDAAARHTGLTAEDVGNSFNRLKKAREGAIAGDKASIEAFGALGVSMEMVRDRSKELADITATISGNLSGREITDSEDAAAMDLFSKSGAKMLSVIQNLQKVGKIKLISKEDIDAVVTLDKEIGILERDIKQKVGGSIAKSWIGLRFLVGSVGIEVQRLVGHITQAEADAKKMALVGNITGEGPAIPKPKTTGDPHYAATRVVDLHKDDNEILRGNLELQEKIRRNNLATLTTTEQLAELKEQIADDEDKATRAMYEGNDLESQKFARRAEDRRSELIALQHKRGKDLSVDSLNRIGGLVGGHEQVLAVTARMQLDAARASVKIQQNIYNALLQSNPTIRESLLGS